MTIARCGVGYDLARSLGLRKKSRHKEVGNLGFDVKLRMVAHHFLRPQEAHMQVLVRDNNVDQALRILKKKLQREGVFREMRLREAFEKPSIKKAREKAEAVGRRRKLARKQMQREGLLPTNPRKGK